METTKKDKYVLLNDDSDLEEFDKINVGLIPPNQKEGKKYLSKTKVRRRCSTCCNLRWACHTFFIFLLLISQVVLSLAVVKLYWDLEDIKRDQLTKEISEPGILDGEKLALQKLEKTSSEQLYSRINSLSSQFKELNTSVVGMMTHMNEDKQGENTGFKYLSEVQNMKNLEEKVTGMSNKMRILQLMVEGLQGNSSGMLPNAKVPAESTQLSYNKTIVLSIQIMKGEILQLEEMMDGLTQQFAILENSTVTWLSTLQNQLYNVTDVANHLQSRIAEGLDSAFAQITQLEDDIRHSENVSANNNFPGDSDISASSYSGVSSYLTHPTGNPTQSPPGTAHQSHRALTENDANDSGILDQASFNDYSSGMQAATAEEPPTSAIEVVKDTSEEKYNLDIVSIKNFSDLKSFFYGADKDADGYLSYTEIVDFLQEEAPTEDEMERFDEDHNYMFSYSEMLKALGLDD
ncbi:uncharacterized protein LOC122793532 isoform X1 [Protopterus annectens]|uniref:uncharacterized protein LOC122793532 isoform X1 n=1 Tax=Protopterus annectens TaxID=7888 RepID=UPI001CF9F541|nr:uncharacterized protein LOC122793532 isoform X1 [Protopterus annectens]